MAMAAPRLCLSFILASTLCLFHFSPSHQLPIEFTYTGPTGPDMWGNLNPNFSICVHGKTQSPINIVTSQAVLNKNLKPLIRSYNSTIVTLVNNKFNVGLRYPDHSGALTIDNKIYALKQMHWHAPSEHRVDGKRFAAELHLVHIADDGGVSVVAILFKLGHPDPLLAKLQAKLRELAYEVKTHHEETPIPVEEFHPTEVRKRCHKYYRYVGSFTTPPCSQGVIWNILARVRTISREQVQALKTPLDMRCKNNSRPCQPMNGRHVEMYDEDVLPH